LFLISQFKYKYHISIVIQCAVNASRIERKIIKTVSHALNSVKSSSSFNPLLKWIDVVVVVISILSKLN
jgi:hypothetical protein